MGAHLINDSWNKILMTYLDMSPAFKKSTVMGGEIKATIRNLKVM